MKFEALASSSAGNAYIVSDRDTRILLECGVSHKKLQKLSGFSLSEFRACLVTHEHKVPCTFTPDGDEFTFTVELAALQSVIVKEKN